MYKLTAFDMQQDKLGVLSTHFIAVSALYPRPLFFGADRNAPIPLELARLPISSRCFALQGHAIHSVHVTKPDCSVQQNKRWYLRTTANVPSCTIS